MLWVTRNKPHVDRCASAWLIKRFIDKEAKFNFISREDPIPEDAIAFTLPEAQIKPEEGKQTTYDVLLRMYSINDPIAIRIGEFVHDFEIDAEENPKRVSFSETLGLCYILKGLEKTSRTDHKTIEKALTVLDALSTSLRDEQRKE